MLNSHMREYGLLVLGDSSRLTLSQSQVTLFNATECYEINCVNELNSRSLFNV